MFTLSSLLEVAYGKIELLRLILVKLYKVVTPRFRIALKSLLWSVLTETDFFSLTQLENVVLIMGQAEV